MCIANFKLNSKKIWRSSSQTGKLSLKRLDKKLYLTSKISFPALLRQFNLRFSSIPKSNSCNWMSKSVTCPWKLPNLIKSKSKSSKESTKFLRIPWASCPQSWVMLHNWCQGHKVWPVYAFISVNQAWAQSTALAQTQTIIQIESQSCPVATRSSTNQRCSSRRSAHPGTSKPLCRLSGWDAPLSLILSKNWLLSMYGRRHLTTITLSVRWDTLKAGSNSRWRMAMQLTFLKKARRYNSTRMPCAQSRSTGICITVRMRTCMVCSYLTSKKPACLNLVIVPTALRCTVRCLLSARELSVLPRFRKGACRTFNSFWRDNYD